ncbi:hypothetical protein PC116_g30213 [Phytophthora cactorum]|nr:hypothetical protein PC116_g30213 [Phytophthora cactorum]
MALFIVLLASLTGGSSAPSLCQGRLICCFVAYSIPAVTSCSCAAWSLSFVSLGVSWLSFSFPGCGVLIKCRHDQGTAGVALGAKMEVEVKCVLARRRPVNCRMLEAVNCEDALNA